MAIKKYVILDADKQRKLRYGTNAIIELEEYFQQPITKLNLEKLSFKDLRAMVWAGLIHEDPELTKEETGNVMDAAENLTHVIKKATEALTIAMGGEETEKNQQPAMTAKQPE